MSKNTHNPRNSDGNLAEDVLRDAGKSEEEVKRTGTVDRLDDEADATYDAKGRTVNSPVHKLVWGGTSVSHFNSKSKPANKDVDATVDRCIALVQAHIKAGTLYDAKGKVTRQVEQDLGAAGYWGMMIDQKYGGQGASTRTVMRMIADMAAKGDATVAGYTSIHGCIGAVDPVRTFGNEDQKAYFLPRLASGKAISAFALTEPNAGSDLTALRTKAVLDGDDYVITGEKLFISNAIPGRTIGIVCMIDGKPSVLIAELPEVENEQFQIVHYGIHAIKHGYNNGLKFNGFRVPAKNRLVAPGDNGLLIPYHGLNYGRVALCANAAGAMRLLLRSITPGSWAAFRRTYGQAIEKRELVQKRMARLAALIVGAEALVDWSSTLLDDGYRGELECVIAKIFGSEAQKEAAIDIAMKTHGGRSFLHGHIVGDNLHDFLAPCIYEGEGEMLGMAFFKSLAKDHGLKYMMPIGNSLKKIKKGQVFTGIPGIIFHGLRYVTWRTPKEVRRFFANFGLAHKQTVPGMNKRLQAHVNFALRMFTEMRIELTNNMVKHQLALADRQCRLALMSQRIQDSLIMLVTALYAHRVGDEVTIAAADILCQDLKRKLVPALPSDEYFRDCTKLAKLIIDGKMKQLDGVPESQILRPYTQD